MTMSQRELWVFEFIGRKRMRERENYWVIILFSNQFILGINKSNLSLIDFSAFGINVRWFKVLISLLNCV